LYSYSHESQKYIKSNKNENGISAEIWHGVISPNPDLVDYQWNELDEEEIYDVKIDELKQYFNKDHDFYVGQWLFQPEKWILSGWAGSIQRFISGLSNTHATSNSQKQSTSIDDWEELKDFKNTIKTNTYTTYSQDIALDSWDRVQLFAFTSTWSSNVVVEDFQIKYDTVTSQWESLHEDYEPYVFYYNQAVEEKSINPEKYLAYQAWLENREDIAYNRFSTKLSERIDQIINGSQQEELAALFNKVAPSLAWNYESVENPLEWEDTDPATPSIQGVWSDIQAMQLILGSIKKYIETFSGPTISDLQKWWLYSWRYW